MKKIVSFILSLIMIASASASFAAAGSEYDSSEIFVDVPADAWFAPYVDYVASRGIMGGDGRADTFKPDNFSTRAMIAVILHRFEGEPAASGSSPFTDLSDDWYVAAVDRAYEAGVVKGTSAVTFSPDGEVTRQELVTMFFRYASLRGLDVTERAPVFAFPDGGAVADWATDAMEWALGTGLVVGRDSGSSVLLAPEDKMPRCELATVLTRFLPKFEEKSGVDPLFTIADELKDADACSAHGAILHIETGSPESETEYALSAAILAALGLDPSIYDVTFADGVYHSFADTYGNAKNGEFVTVPLSFEIDNVRTTDGPVSFESVPVAFLRNDFYSSPRAVRCDTDRIEDEALNALLGDVSASYACTDHGCVHLEAGTLTEASFARAVADLFDLDEDDYEVVPETDSFYALKNAFDGIDAGDETGVFYVAFTVKNEAIKRECGYDAESGVVLLGFSAMKTDEDGCRAAECPHARATDATELFLDKYVCREHGKAHVALGHPGTARMSEMVTLITKTLDLGDGYSVSLDADSFARGEIKAEITGPRGAVTDGPSFTPVYSVGEAENEASFTLCENDADAYKLIVHDGYAGNTGYGSWNAGQTESGWLIDTRADDGVRHGTINDVSATECSGVIREVNLTTKGVVNLRTAVTIKSGFDGAILDFRNEADESVLKLRTMDGVWKILGKDGSYSTVYEPDGETKFVFDIKIDLYEERASIVINDRDPGLFPLAEAGVRANIRSFRFASGREEKVTFDLGLCDASVNYGLWEYFPEHQLYSTLPAGWKYENAYISPNTGFAIEAKLFDHYLGVGTGGYAEKSFVPTGGKTVVRFSVLPAAAGSDTVFTAFGGGDALVRVTADDTSFYVNGTKAYDYAKNVWYTFNLDCDTGSGDVKLKINGIDRGEYSLLKTGVPFDAVRVDNGGEPATYDAFFVYEDVSHGDYVAEPVKPAGEEEYTVGMNTCCMWQNGFHGGWACITPYDEIRPVLGYYDEGVPETADWEIKYMVEHGVDFQSFVLFGVQETGPVTVGLGMHLEDGYKYAKYNDMLDYCLIWCSASGSSPRDMDAWRDYFVPYLIETHFKDPHYLVIDNKPVLQFFRFINSSDCPYWTTERRKEALDYLDEEVRKLGFDGMIYIIEAITENSAEEGIDALYSYNQGELCTTFEKLKYYIEGNSSEAEYTCGLYYVPSAAIGFNRVGWMEDRTPLMTPDDFRKSVEWIRDEYLPGKSGDAPDWAKNLTIVCTWNEYGEGHYLMPCDGLYGFDYLDVLRETFTSESADESLNARPTEAQAERINRLYPQDLRLIRAEESGTYTNGVYDPVPFTGKTYEWIDEIGIGSCVVGYDDNLTLADGVICNDSSAQGFVTLRVCTDMDISKCAYAGVRIFVPERKIYMIYGGTGDHGNFERFSSLSLVGSGVEEDVSFGILTDGTEQLVRIRLPAGAKLYSLKIAADVKTYFPYKLNLLGSDIPHKVLPEISPRGDYLFGFDTIFTDLHPFGAFAEWDAEAGTLRLSFPGGVFEFTVGSAFCTLNGERYYLGYKIRKTDGVPMIPLNLIADKMGYTVDYTDIRNASVGPK